jgi:nitrite reductase/ring-hydroxylating ferredoxin subunit
MVEEFKKTVSVNEVPPGKMKTVWLSDEEAVLIANVEGKYYAIGGICTHEQWDLSEGTLVDKKVICAGHGTVWDLETGKGEFTEPLPDEPVYEVKIQEGYIWVRKKI